MTETIFKGFLTQLTNLPGGLIGMGMGLGVMDRHSSVSKVKQLNLEGNVVFLAFTKKS